jgi:polyphenol oxidase
VSWKLTERDGLALIEYDSLSGLGVRHGIVVKRDGGIIDEQAVYAALGRDTKLVVTEQTHSDRVAKVDDPFTTFYPERVEVDGLMTNRNDVTITIHTADCVPVLVASRTAVMLVHAGWRGSAQSIVARAVAGFTRAYDAAPDAIHAVVGPAICPACYPVGDEVAGRFTAEVKQRRDDGAWNLDLKQENRRQLLAAGIPGGQITVSSHCTRCDAALFHSYRREGRLKGTMIAFMEVSDA